MSNTLLPQLFCAGSEVFPNQNWLVSQVAIIYTGNKVCNCCITVRLVQQVINLVPIFFSLRFKPEMNLFRVCILMKRDMCTRLFLLCQKQGFMCIYKSFNIEDLEDQKLF